MLYYLHHISPDPGAEAGRALCGHLPPQTSVKKSNFNTGGGLYLSNS